MAFNLNLAFNHNLNWNQMYIDLERALWMMQVPSEHDPAEEQQMLLA